MRAEYGLDLRIVVDERTLPVSDVAELVAWLPRGCAFWKDFGGPAAVPDIVDAIRNLDYSVRVLDYHQRGGKGRKPKEPVMPPYSHERRAQDSDMLRKADAYRARQQRA